VGFFKEISPFKNRGIMAREKTKYPGVFQEMKISKKLKKEDTFFYIRFYDPDGKEHFEKCKGSRLINSLTAARANQIRTQKMTGDLLPNKAQRKIELDERSAHGSRWTFSRLWADYRSDKKETKSLATDDGRFKNYLEPDFGNEEPSDIDPLMVRRLRKKLEKTLKPQTVKHILALLKRIANHGVSCGHCRPLDFKIDLPAVDNETTEDLTEDQLSALWIAMDSDENKQAANLMKMVLFTGMRRGELFKLKWENINFDRGFIEIVDPKGKKNQKIPLNSSARELLVSHERPFPESSFVFPGKNGQQRTEIRKPVNRIKEKAGLPKVFRALHGLRHVYASMLASSGEVDMYHLQRLLTHKSFKTTARYAHLRDDALKQASEVAGDIVGDIVNKEKSDKVKKLS
jgi:integrase